MAQKLLFHTLPPELNRIIAAETKVKPQLTIDLQPSDPDDWQRVDPSQPLKIKLSEPQPLNNTEYDSVINDFIKFTDINYEIKRGEILKFEYSLRLYALEEIVDGFVQFEEDVKKFENMEFDKAKVELPHLDILRFGRIIGVSQYANYELSWEKYGNLFVCIFRNMLECMRIIIKARKRELQWW